GFEITTIIYLRPESEQINSAYAQQIKTFLTDETVTEYARKRIDRSPFRYQNLIYLTKMPGIEARFYSYDDELKRTGVTRHFLGAIGLSQDDISTLGPERRVNESVGPIAIAVARDTLARISRSGQQPSQRQRIALKKALAELMAAERD